MMDLIDVRTRLPSAVGPPLVKSQTELFSQNIHLQHACSSLGEKRKGSSGREAEGQHASPADPATDLMNTETAPPILVVLEAEMNKLRVEKEALIAELGRVIAANACEVSELKSRPRDPRLVEQNKRLEVEVGKLTSELGSFQAAASKATAERDSMVVENSQLHSQVGGLNTQLRDVQAALAALKSRTGNGKNSMVEKNKPLWEAEEDIGF